MIEHRIKKLIIGRERAIIAEATSCKKLWHAVKTVCNLNNSRTEPEKFPDVSNNYFCSVGPVTATSVRQDVSHGTNYSDYWIPGNTNVNSFRFSPVSLKDMYEAIHTMKHNSPGNDYINKKILVDALPIILEPLRHIANASHSAGVFPGIWKRAHVIPVYKKCNTDNSSSYRPISLLSFFGKLTENLANFRFMNSSIGKPVP